MRMPFYAVAKGRQTGIFNNWGVVQPLVHGFRGAKYKKFNTYDQAQEYIEDYNDEYREEFPAEHANPYPGLTPGDAILHQVDGGPRISHGDLDDGTIYTLNSVDSDEEEDYLRSIGREPLMPNPPKLRVQKPAVPSLNDLNISSSFARDGLIVEKPRGSDIVIYTDGASRNNGRQNAIAGYGIFTGPKPSMNFAIDWRLCNAYGCQPTNQTTEILGVLHALKLFQYYCSRIDPDDFKYGNLIIRTDSKYAIDCLTSWWRGWQKNGWRTSTGKPVMHRQLIQECLDLISFINGFFSNSPQNLLFEHVRGHEGNFGNEMADQLANYACDRLTASIANNNYK